MNKTNRARAIFSGSAGNLVEWYDWYTYSAFALYFAPIFFPSGDMTAQLLSTAAIFAVGFFARPVGAWVTGLVSDRAGRKLAMMLSVGLMCVGSLIIAVTPGADQIGVAAPIILVLARILQGLALGGEYGVSSTYLSEVAGAKRRGLWASFSSVTLIGGQMVALAVLIILQRSLAPEDLSSWGWRVAFVIGALLAVGVFFIRTWMEESQSYINARAAGAEKATTRLLLFKHPRETLTIIGLTAGGTLMFYVYTTYMQKYLVNTTGFSKEQATEISAATLVVFMLAQPLLGWISDFVGRKAVLGYGFLCGALFTYPIMTSVGEASTPMMAFLLISTGIMIQSGYSSISGLVKAEMFPANVRTLGVALPYAIANAIFGGTAEYVALWFKSVGNEQGFYIYASAILVVSFIIVMTMRDTRKHTRIEED